MAAAAPGFTANDYVSEHDAAMACHVGGCANVYVGNGNCNGLIGSPADPTVNKSFCADYATDNSMDPTDYGCTSWDACQFSVSSWAMKPNTNSEDNEYCCWMGVVDTYGCDDAKEPATARIDYATCVKVGYDDTYRQPCCFGTASDPNTQCAPGWCPSDPYGLCTDLFVPNCTGTSSCGRHKFLTPSQTADMNGAPCNAWYLAAKDFALQGVYWPTCTNYSTQGSCTTWASSTYNLDPLMSVSDEINRYCTEEGLTSGECGCYNAYLACNTDDEGQAGCLIAGDTGGARDVYRRVDIYCNGGFSTTSADGSWVTMSSTCDPNVTYGAQTINPGSSNPYVPPGGVNPFPAHCWLPACQLQSDDCIFKNLVDLQRACPPICMQFASGNSVVINGSTTPTVHVNVDDVNCGDWNGVTTVSISPYVWPSSEASIQMPVGYMASFTVPLLNTSLDSATSFNTMATDFMSTLEPVVTLPAAAGNPVSLPNNSVTSVWVTVDAGGLFAGQFYEGSLAAVDHTGANGPAFMPFTLNVAGPDDQCTVQLADGPPITPTVYPSSRPPNSAPSVATEGSVQGFVAATPGARGQARAPTSKKHALQQRQGMSPWSTALLAVGSAVVIAALVTSLVLVLRTKRKP